MRRLAKILFSKKILGLFMLLMQLYLLLRPILGVYGNQRYVNFFAYVLSAVVIVYEINRETDSGFKLIWIAILALFPVFGIFLYIYVHSDIIMLKIRKKAGKIFDESISGEDSSVDITNLPDNACSEYGIFRYLETGAKAPCFQCRNARYFELGEHMFKALLEDISNAKKYIFMEFFIINENDKMWRELLSVLTAKAKSGVEVRIIYDAMGCLSIIKGDFVERMEKHGIRCCTFAPLVPFLSTYHNNRDHRKMVIIDGRLAYTGGVNIADEYINSKVRFGHWKDTAIRIEGPGVNGFLRMYLRQWSFVCNERDNYGDYRLTGHSADSPGYAVPFDDTPTDNNYVTRNLYLHIINSARDYVYINTPYLVLDDALIQALKFAAGRGVDVRICMPHIPDKWYAFAVARSYYPELINSGVKIYEYAPGFLHAKSTVSDDTRAYIGSANYDYRSLYLHYECGVYLYRCPVNLDIKRDFLNTLGSCDIFTMKDYKALGFFYRAIGRILRLFAALM